jgi:hypothetical protein
MRCYLKSLFLKYRIKIKLCRLTNKKKKRKISIKTVTLPHKCKVIMHKFLFWKSYITQARFLNFRLSDPNLTLKKKLSMLRPQNLRLLTKSLDLTTSLNTIWELMQIVRYLKHRKCNVSFLRNPRLFSRTRTCKSYSLLQSPK